VPDPAAPASGEDVGRRALARTRRRLIPFLFVLYIVSYLDRINVGFAALQMNAALGFGARVFGLGAGIFFAGYVLFEVPSNLALERFGARRWIARIMISWGIVSAAMMFVQGTASFYALRFLLGVAEAGFFPGMILYLTYWFPAAERARAVAQFMTATAIAGVIGGPVSGALLTLHGLGDAEQQPQRVPASGSDDERRCRGDEAPRDHDARQPSPRAEVIERDVARDLARAVAEEEDAGAEAELRRRQPGLAVHRQRGKADVVAIHVVEKVANRDERQDSPRGLYEGAVGVTGDQHRWPCRAPR